MHIIYNLTPLHIAIIIAAIVLLALQLAYPKKYVMFDCYFRYLQHRHLLQYWVVPGILARIFFYRKPYQERFLGNGTKWQHYPNGKPVNKRFAKFLDREVKQAEIEFLRGKRKRAGK